MNKAQIWNPFKNEVKCFLACVENKSLTLAAERVGLTQASLTKIIQKLEFEYKKQLFIRHSRGISLTAAGKEFAESLKKIQSNWRTQSYEQIGIESNTLGEFIVGAHASIANTILPYLSHLFFSEYSDSQFKFEFKRSVEITQKVVNAEIDLGFVINPIKNSDLIVKPIRQEFISLWSKNADSSDQVLYNPEMFLSDKILKLIKDKKMIEINDYEVIANVIHATQAMGLLPSTVGERYKLKLQSGKLYSVQLSMIYRKDRFKSKLQREFVFNVFHSLQKVFQ